MLITRRSDYAMRICRVLRDGKVHNVREICEKEDIPKAFAYKILRELEMADLVKSERGNQGGYYLEKSLDELEKIVEKLESGECTLDESIKLFEKGVKYASDCRTALKDAKEKIVNLLMAWIEAEMEK